MRALPPAARVLVVAVALAAAACVAPALRGSTPWLTVAVLAALYAAGYRAPGASFLPVPLAGALLLPPSAAALVAVPGALAARPQGEPRTARRIWHAAQLSVAAYVAAWARLPFGAGHFPSLLVQAVAAALAFWLTSGALLAGVLVTAERRAPAAAARRGLRPGAAAQHLTYGMVGLMTAVLWRGPYGAFAAVPALLPMYVSTWVFAQVRRERAAHRATVRALVQAVEIKDGYTRGHSERVGRASVLIGREIGMPADRVEALRFAGILHDIGKLGMPTRLLRKDGPLTAEERRIIELHPEYGYEMLRGIAFLGEARDAILYHHERLDGTGYPHGLAGDAIPPFARVVAVADAFDAMTSARMYSRPRPVPEALAELRRCAGTQFDPVVVEALTAAIGRHGWPLAAATADDPGPFLLGANDAAGPRHARRAAAVGPAR